MSPIKNATSVPQSEGMFGLTALALDSHDKSKLVLSDGQFTRHGTNMITRFFSNLADRFSSRRAQANADSLHAFKLQLRARFGADEVKFLEDSAYFDGAKCLTAGLVKRCVDAATLRDMLNEARLTVANAKADASPEVVEDPAFAATTAATAVTGTTAASAMPTGAASLAKTPPSSPPCAVPHAQFGETADDYGPRLAADYVDKSVALRGRELEDFTQQYVLQVVKDLAAAPKAPNVHSTLNTMRGIVKILLDERPDRFRPLSSCIDVTLASIENPDAVDLAITPLQTSGTSGAMTGHRIDASQLDAKSTWQGANMCFIMSAVRGMLQNPATKEALLDRIRLDDKGVYHIRLTRDDGNSLRDFEVKVTPFALRGSNYQSIEPRPAPFAALECAIANFIVENTLDPRYQLGRVGLGEISLGLLGLQVSDDPAKIFESSALEDFSANLGEKLADPNSVVIFRIPTDRDDTISSGGHWFSLLGAEGENVLIGDSINPTSQRTMTFAELHSLITGDAYGYQIFSGTLLA